MEHDRISDLDLRTAREIGRLEGIIDELRKRLEKLEAVGKGALTPDEAKRVKESLKPIGDRQLYVDFSEVRKK